MSYQMQRTASQPCTAAPLPDPFNQLPLGDVDQELSWPMGSLSAKVSRPQQVQNNIELNQAFVDVMGNLEHKALPCSLANTGRHHFGNRISMHVQFCLPLKGCLESFWLLCPPSQSNSSTPCICCYRGMTKEMNLFSQDVPKPFPSLIGFNHTQVLHEALISCLVDALHNFIEMKGDGASVD
ncbi:hypothetical protein DM01DRAFT_1143604 [Hesseltinella vesiculosa]|uniref:Uncharacterized protein n=1 Tax=Hesseltinella vesiculosa TaxID=101127 RepID=A0A1X2G7X5_9FUNG|nr:hypothetical protein DM01DRAFT_1143604 [Hesseltinella vesiculosa]